MAVAYDAMPIDSHLYEAENNTKIKNARTTAGLNSGGTSFGPASIYISQASNKDNSKSFVEKILNITNSGHSL